MCLSNDVLQGTHEPHTKLGVSKGGFVRGGGISIIGVVRTPRTPVAIINFAFFVLELLLES